MNQPQDFEDMGKRFQEAIQSPQIVNQRLKDDQTFPNNERLPLLVYQSALVLPSKDPASIVEDLFELNGWSGSWRNGVYAFHHYHSIAHEVLGVYSGTAQIQLGGDNGIALTVRCGDVIIIPAGVAHKNLGAAGDFRIVGAYPRGQSPDMCYGKAGERPQTDQNISKVPLPQKDPVYGSGGPILEKWRVLLKREMI